MKPVLRLAAIGALFAVSLSVHGVPVVQVAKAQDDIVVQPPCDEEAFDEAVQLADERAGGTITFDCGGVVAIQFTSVKTIAIPVTIDGADQIILSGGNSTQLFQVDDSLTLRRLTLTLGFSEADGGAIVNDGTLIVEHSTIQNNHATGSGGGIYNEGAVFINRSTLTGNTALAYGGGMANAGEATIQAVLFYNNASTIGSAVHNFGLVTIQNATFSGNMVGEDGDGVMGNYGEATIQYATFSDNIDNSGEPGASTLLHSSVQPLKLQNVVLKLFAEGFGGVNCSSSSLGGDVPITSEGFNLSDDNSCAAFFTNAGDKNNIDPQLGPLRNNGGPTMTHLPQPGSPLIDGGQCIPDLTTDQRGIARPQGAACDIGALEVQTEEHHKVYVPLVQR